MPHCSAKKKMLQMVECNCGGGEGCVCACACVCVCVVSLHIRHILGEVSRKGGH